MAYYIINNIGLGNYYQMRLGDVNSPKIKPELSEKINLTEFVITENDDSNRLLLAVDKMHCAACVWLIESILQKQENVILARINLTKKYLLLKWRGPKDYGNRLAQIIREIGYGLFPFDEKILQEEEKKYSDDLLKCLAVAGFGVGNVMLFSSILWFNDLSQISQITIDFMHFCSALIALPVIIYAARPFFSSAFKALRSKIMNMDLAISVAIFLACIVSLFESFRSAIHVYFDSAIMLVFFLLIGRYFDFKARKKAFSIAREFSLLSTNFARQLLVDGTVKIIANKDIKQDMILLVSSGDKIPADAVVIDGRSEVNMMIINGESTPRQVEIASELFAGTTNLGDPLKIRVTKDPQNSLLKQIVKIVEEVENQKNTYIRIADRLARIYAPLVHILAFFTFALWYLFYKTNAEDALLNATAVLIITCPCALALAVPIVQTITISLLLKKGVLTKSGEALEKINDIDTIIFDKTGTLTIGEPKLLDIKSLKGNSLTDNQKDFYLQIAASMAAMSNHPISRAIFKAWDKKLLTIPTQENQGFGLIANYLQKNIYLGRAQFCNIQSIYDTNKTSTNCYLKYGDDEIIFILQDQLKSDAKDVLQKLDSSKNRLILLSGDNYDIVRETAQILAINEFYAEQTPVQKVEFIKKLKSQNHKILMVGDGLNDAPALALSDVSISFSQAANIAQNAADIVIQSNQLQPIFHIINLAKSSILLIKQNLFLALIYNLIAVPFAIMGHVTPLLAAIAMSSSSILVLLNSLRILK